MSPRSMRESSKKATLIFEVLVYGCGELTPEQMIAAHGPMSDYGLPDQAQRWLARAQQGRPKPVGSKPFVRCGMFGPRAHY